MELTIMNNKTITTITSNEIAELTGKRHDNVLRDIEEIIDQLNENSDNSEMSSEIIQTNYKNSRGKMYNNYTLTKDGAMLLLTGYSVKLRMTVIKRLSEFERELNENGFIVSNNISNEQIEQAKEVFNIRKLTNDLATGEISSIKYCKQVTEHFKKLKFSHREKELKVLQKNISVESIQSSLTLAHETEKLISNLKSEYIKSQNRSKGKTVAHRDKKIKELEDKANPTASFSISYDGSWMSVNHMYSYAKAGVKRTYRYNNWIKDFPTELLLNSIPSSFDATKPFKIKLSGKLKKSYDVSNLFKSIADQVTRDLNLKDDNHINEYNQDNINFERVNNWQDETVTLEFFQ